MSEEVKIGKKDELTSEEIETRKNLEHYSWFYFAIEKVAHEEGIQIAQGTKIETIEDALKTFLEG